MTDIDHLNRFQAVVATATDAGIKPENEDAVGYRIPDNHLITTKGAVVVIADGVSSAEAGREASTTCVDTFLNEYFTTPETWSVKNAAQKLLTSLNLKLYNLGKKIPDESQGYITTLSLIIFKSQTGYILHIGDSRVYRLRDTTFEQLTTDHSARIDKNKFYLTRAMGMDVHLNVDYLTVDLLVGDVFLLSTDGIHDVLSNSQLEAILHAHKRDSALACRELITHALAMGSKDNLSCALIHIDDLGLEDVEDFSERLTKLPFPPELEPGLKIDGYEVVKELYASQRSQLYIVKEIDSGDIRVMKTPSQNYSDDPAYIERFILEEWIGSRIDHPNVVSIVPTNDRRRFLYYLMEWVPGVSLDVWMQENPEARPSVIIKIVEQIISGLTAFHEKETIHQDLKPSNIMITPQREIKLVDFGSVYTPGVSEIFTPVEREIALGTASYSDPEYRLGRNSGIKGDIFSLGVIIYQMFTGYFPYGHKLERCKTARDFEALEYVPSAVYRDIIPQWFDGAIKKATEINPDQRYSNLQQFLQDLTHPNPEFLREQSPAVLEKNMLTFWKLLSFLLMGIIFILILLLAQ